MIHSFAVLPADNPSTVLPFKKGKSRRVSAPKVKTGCLTCRIRRIKCDEQKPYCDRCVSTGRLCDGYLSILPKSHKPSRRSSICDANQVILPNLSSSKEHATANSSSSYLFKRPVKRLSNLRTQFMRNLFSDENEYRYFSLFCDKVSLQLSGFYKASVWNRLILQASEQNESIRHAVVAIGALDMTLETAKNPSQRYTSLTMVKHHEFALEQYSAAISRMRSLSAESPGNLRTTLLACLLIFCFETLHGNHEAALTQVHIGLRLLEDWIKNQTDAFDSSSRTQAQLMEDQESRSSTFGIESPAPNQIEDEIVQAFGRLDMQAVSFVDPRPSNYHLNAKQCGNTSLAKMPAKFSSIAEARMYWELVMRRLMHFISSIIETNAQHETSGTTGGILNRNLQATRRIRPTAHQDQMTHLDEAQRWSSAFSAIFHQSTKEPTCDDFAPATLLQLRYKAAYIALSCSLSRTQMIFDKYVTEFTEIVTLAKSLIAHSRAIGAFTVDLGFIAQLYVVAIRCRISSIRCEAISILLSRPWREGVWDSILAGKMGALVMEFEERGRKKGMIPDSARVMATSVSFSLQDRKATVKCVLGGYEETRVEVRDIKW